MTKAPIKILRTAAILFLTQILTGCYPMPRDGEYSTIPTTNNPDVVGTRQTPLIPGSGF